jgi:glutathione S-transferase
MHKSIKLWSFADVDRSGKVRWTARELGYEIEEIRVGLGEHTSDPYRQLNPYEQIPTAELDGKILLESTAICLSLASRHPQAGLIPADRSRLDIFWQSISLSTSTLEMPVVQYYLSKSGFMDEVWTGLLEAPLRKRVNVFARELPDNGYICGDFTLADVCAAYVLRLGVQSELLPFEGKLETYMRSLMARPAAQAARIFDSLDV